MVISLFGSCGFGFLLGVPPVETIDAPRSIDQLLLTGKERMAGRTNFHVQVVFACGSSLKGLATGAGNGNFFIFRMNSGFHFLLTLYSRQYLCHSNKQSYGPHTGIVKLVSPLANNDRP